MHQPHENSEETGETAATSFSNKVVPQIDGNQSATFLTDGQYRGFIENLPVLFYAVDPTPPYSPIYVSPAFSRFGYPLEDWTNDPEMWIRAIHPEDRERIFAETTESTATGEVVDYEYRIVDAKGSIHWVRDRGCLIRNSNGNLVCREGVILDITDRKRAEEELILGEERFRNIFENASDIIYVHDLDGNYLSINDAGERVFGYTREETLSMNMRQIVVPEQVALIQEQLARKIDGGPRQTSYEVECGRKDGRRITLEVNSSVIYMNGSPVAVQGIARDITERKIAEAAIRDSEAQFRALAETASDAIITIDENGVMSYVNAGTEKIFGHTAEEMMGKDLTMLIPERFRQAHRKGLNRYLKSGKRNIPWKTVELPGLHRDGQEIELELSFAEYDKDGKRFFTSVIRDITQRKSAQNSLRKSEENLAAAQRLTKLGSWELEIHNVEDSRENVVVWSDEVYRIFGYEPKAFAVTSEFVYSAVHADERELVSERFTEAVKTRKFLDFETRIFLPCGSIRLVHCQAETIYDTADQPVKMVGTVQDITERRAAENALRESESRFRDLFENANDLIYTHDLQGNFTSINQAGEKITGYTREEAVTMNVSQVVAPEFLEQARRMITTKVEGDGPTAYELEIVAKNGNRVSLELSTRLMFVDGRPVGVQGIGRDITERKRTEEALKVSESRYRQLGEGILHQIWTARPDGMLDYVNKRTLEYFERSNSEMLGDGWRNVIHPDDLDECLKRWANSLHTGEPYETEFRLRRHDGQYRWHVAKATAGRDSLGSINKWFGTNTDVHEQKLSEEKLNYYARHDPLTNLPNRVEFMNHLRHAIARSASSPDARFAVLFLDLDRFKVINDSLGHVIGDKLLVAIAARLKGTIRPGDVVARLGGDEFTILLNRTGGESDVENVVERLQTKISDPFMIDNYEVFTTASVGIILSDDMQRTADEYLRDADAAMYRAKEGGKARYEVFDREMHVRNLNLLQVETDLRHAVERNEFEVLYQPIVELENGRISEFEALIRWRHPKHGLISPHEFIGVAEETGLIVPIGKWILNESCRQIAAWQEDFDRMLSVSVNLSARQLMHPTFISQVDEILLETGLKPGQLKLEVTESTVMEYSEKASSVLDELDRMGVQLSTDDFGTGYSSLSYLQSFPFDRLKIDRSFIVKLGENKKSDAIVKTILMLGTNLDMQVVAEGIETGRQLELLQVLGCKLGQGYYFSRPVTAEAAVELLTSNAAVSAFDPSLRLTADEPVFEFTGVQ